MNDSLTAPIIAVKASIVKSPNTCLYFNHTHSKHMFDPLTVEITLPDGRMCDYRDGISLSSYVSLLDHTLYEYRHYDMYNAPQLKITGKVDKSDWGTLQRSDACLSFDKITIITLEEYMKQLIDISIRYNGKSYFINK